MSNVNSLGGLLGPAMFNNVGSIEQAAGTTIDIDDVDINAQGDVEIDFAAAVNLEKVETANGNITISSLGTLTATEVRTGMDNAISLTATGATSDIVVGTIDAGTGDVTLDAEDDIRDSNSADANIVTSSKLTATSSNGTNDANNGVTLDTNITDLRLDTASSFNVDNTGILANLEITVDPTTPGMQTYELVSVGDVFSLADSGANLNVDNVVTNANFAITATNGDVLVGEIDASGTVSVTAMTGSINDATDDTLVDITSGGLITLTARDDIAGAIAGIVADRKLELAAGSQVVAMSTSAGDIRLRGLGAVTLVDVTAEAGSIDVMASGEITAINVNAKGLLSDVTLRTTLGGVEITKVEAGHDVVIDADAGDITDGDTGIDDNDITAGNDIFLAANMGNIGRVDGIFKDADYNLLEVEATNNLSAIAPLGSIALASVVGGAISLNANANETIFFQTSGDLDVSTVAFNVENLALVATGGLLTIGNSLSVTGDLRIEGDDISAGGNPINLIADRLLLKSAASENIQTNVNELDAVALGSLIVTNDGDLTLTDLDCDGLAVEVVNGDFKVTATGARY